MLIYHCALSHAWQYERELMHYLPPSISSGPCASLDLPRIYINAMLINGSSSLAEDTPMNNIDQHLGQLRKTATELQGMNTT